MKDFSTLVSIYGKTVVSLSTWRNAAGTAFASVTIADPWSNGATTEAKSQGPSAGGYHKPTQALERLSSALARSLAVHQRLTTIGMRSVLDRLMDATQRPETWAQVLAQLCEAQRQEGTDQ